MDAVSFEPHTDTVRALIRRGHQLRREDFLSLEDASIAQDDSWESDMQDAGWAAQMSHRQRPVAHAQFCALGALGANARQKHVDLATLIMVGTSLVGAVQAAMMSDALSATTTDRLMADWTRLPDANGG